VDVNAYEVVWIINMEIEDVEDDEEGVITTSRSDASLPAVNSGIRRHFMAMVCVLFTWQVLTFYMASTVYTSVQVLTFYLLLRLKSID
jgi:hypothetical protein